jgi:hypothetical protein
MATLKQREADVVCPSCEESPLVFRPCPVLPIGILPTRPLDLTTQMGVKFETNEQLKTWERQNDVHLESTDSAAWKSRVDSTKNRADKIAQKQGFADLEDKRKKVATATGGSK